MIEISNDLLRARILPLGATLAGLWHQGLENSLVLGFSDPADYLRYPIYAGAIVGPFANRLGGAQARLDGQTFHMPANEGGKTTLHSGPEGLHAQRWLIAKQQTDAVTLTCDMPDGACGLPGNRKISAAYQLDGNRLLLQLSATTDATTLMNLAHHPYWSVDSNAQLCVAADTYLPVNALNLPTGEIAYVTGTAFDYRRTRPIPKDMDHNLVLAAAPRPAPQHAATLTTRDYQLQINTTAPGLQVYSGHGLPEIDADRCTGRPIAANAGIALEPQLWPDAPNHPRFPSAILAPRENWQQLTEYCLDL